MARYNGFGAILGCKIDISMDYLDTIDLGIDDRGGLASYIARAGDCSHKIRFVSIEKSLQLQR